MPNKKPTDAATVKALMDWEKAYNVFLAAIRNGGSPHRELDEDSLVESLTIVRKYAIKAQKRMDAEKLKRELTALQKKEQET